MKVCSQQETIDALPFGRLIEAIDAGFRGEVVAPLRHHHQMVNEGRSDDTLLLMPAWQNEGWGGIKLVNVHPGNGALGLAAISSTYVLFDRRTGRHCLILDGGELTARRTAAASALAAKRLARPDSGKLLVVGAGRVASNIAHAYRAVLSIGTVEVWNRTHAGAEALAAKLESEGVSACAVDDLEGAVAGADIVSCATLATEPFLKGEWLREGQHVDLIGSFTPAMREVDDTAIRRSRIFIDTEHAMIESGEIRSPLERGVLAEDAIAGTLVDLCRTDAYPRRSESEITLFKGVGTAIEDLSAAILAYETTGADAGV
ncbi:ornithine cyclodeaminase family protein [Fulvimarina sp. 2208YS6-2-32]|uniref:Ornithine cyclodeaminase family protein n=1 Tax=Fulvimarina uroteuthidis TaxID=3098149 RepID=A0ABU5HY68_9HYPH|nr:ornithine cyclodeaminase family protein [Fulvimarina sp. 2208YS6-2-32]MDY8107718.1 ornithine cyclodeaminase family protein [Fulvimarina sp. 2208YS6-2-32]